MDTKKEAYDIIEKLKSLSDKLEYKDQTIENLNSQLEKSKQLIIKLNNQIETYQEENKHIKNILKTKISEVKKLMQENESIKNKIEEYKTQLIYSKQEAKKQLGILKETYESRLREKEQEHIKYQLALKEQIEKLNKPEREFKNNIKIPKKSFIFNDFNENPEQLKQKKIQEIIDTIKLAKQHGDTEEGIKISLLNMGHSLEHIEEAMNRIN